MKPFPEAFTRAWQEREPLAALSTVNATGTPNVIWVLCMDLSAEEARLVIADNAMDKTLANVDAHTDGALVFLALPRRAYQLKGPLTRHTEGPLYEAMKQGWLEPSFPGRSAVHMDIREIWHGAELVWQRHPC